MVTLLACGPLGVRYGGSTVALLAGLEAGGGGTLISYDVDPCREAVEPLERMLDGHPSVTWDFLQLSTLTAPTIDFTDVLFIDTVHTAEQVYAELTYHSPRVRHMLAFHDTVACAERDKGQPGPPLGLLWGIHGYMHEQRGQWELVADRVEDNGFRVYRRVALQQPNPSRG